MNTNEIIIANAVERVQSDYAGRNGALAFAHDYGVMLAEYYDMDAIDKINPSYNDVFILVYGNDLPLSKEEWTFAVRDAWSWRMSDHRSEVESGKPARFPIAIENEVVLRQFMRAIEMEPGDYTLENEKGDKTVNAKSALGVMYMFYEEGGLGHNYFLVKHDGDSNLPQNLSFLGRAF